MKSDPVVVDAVRTPIGRGKVGGSLSTVHPVELLSTLLRALVQRNDLDPGLIDDVLIGCVSQAGEQSATPGRMAVLAAGFPEHVPSTTIDRRCGSSQQAVHFAAQAIASGAYDIAIAGGVESMSRVPMGSARMGQDPFGAGVQERYTPGLVSQGIAAELVSAKWGFTREELDAYSVRSHERASAGRDSGAFSSEIVPIRLHDGTVIREDETIRSNTNLASLGGLRPSFVDAAMQARFPSIAWSITPGNSSQISDGASAVLMMSEAMASRLNRTPLARFAGYDVCGADPILMLTAPMPATRRVLKKAGLTADDIGHFEVNEAFAPVPLAWQRELGVEDGRLNPLGGAIALGHPLGASGTRLLTTMIHSMQRNAIRYGLQTMCEAGGMANATVIERL